MSEQQNDDRARAERESQGCSLCHGSGLAIVFHPDWKGKQIEPGGQPLDVAAHCVCQMGRWIRDRSSDEIRIRIPDGIRIANGKSIWSFEQPDDGVQDTIWNEEEGREWMASFRENGGAKALVKSPR